MEKLTQQHSHDDRFCLRNGQFSTQIPTRENQSIMTGLTGWNCAEVKAPSELAALNQSVLWQLPKDRLYEDVR
ncbi:MAG: hypothetical protein ABJM29_20305 [Rhizobiaceae bacterium]